jgi:hypothetical protein
MKKLVITGLLLVFGFSYAAAQRGSIDKPLTQEQRMVQSNAKHKNGRNADVSKKVKRAKKQDRSARKQKAPKSHKPPKR